MQSKIKNFRFSDAMCNDLDRLVSVWNCTATEAVARALNQSVSIEDWKAYSMVVNQNTPAEQHPAESQMQQEIQQSQTQEAAEKTVESSTATPESAQEPDAQLKEKKQRIQVRICVDGKRVASPSTTLEKRAQLDAKVKQILEEKHLEPLTPFDHSEGISFRLDCIQLDCK